MKKLIILLFLLFPLVAFPLDVVTYYFDAYDSGGEEWETNPGYMVDNKTFTYAGSNTLGDIELCNGNTCDGTDLGTITKVEIRAFGLADPGGSSNAEVSLRPVFTGGDGTNHDIGDIFGDWSSYIDITTDTNAPTWNWTHIQNLDCDVEITAEGASFVGKVAKVEIQVTYETVATVVEPAVLPLTMTLHAPTVSDFASYSAPVLGLALTLHAPTISATDVTRIYGATIYGATIN